MGSPPKRKPSFFCFHRNNRYSSKRIHFLIMKRRAVRRSSTSTPSRSRSLTASKPLTRSRTKSLSHAMPDATEVDVLSRSQIENDLIIDILDDVNGYHHCRVCDQTFNTSSQHHFIPQWKSHKNSKKHDLNKQQLLQQMKNGKVSVRRSCTVAVATSRVNTVSDHESGTTSSYDMEQDVESESSDETEGIPQHHIVASVKKRNIRRPRLDQEQKVEEEEEQDKERNSDTTTGSMSHPIHGSKVQSERTNAPRFKSTAEKHRYSIDCPFCATSDTVHIPVTSFQLQNVICCDTECGEEYWVQINDGEPVVTKKYPFSTTIPADALRNMRGKEESRSSPIRNHRKRKKADSEGVDPGGRGDKKENDSSPEIEVISPPRKKRRRNHSNNNNSSSRSSSSSSVVECKHQTIRVEEAGDAMLEKKTYSYSESACSPSKSVELDDAIKRNPERTYFEADSQLSFLIPRDADTVAPSKRKHRVQHSKCDQNIAFNHVVRPYECKMSHIEMARPCARTLCSDFIAGDSHCWEAVPMLLPGNVRMAHIGYRFQCCWCGMETCFVEEEQLGADWLRHNQDSQVVTAERVDGREQNGSDVATKDVETAGDDDQDAIESTSSMIEGGECPGEQKRIQCDDIQRQCRWLRDGVLFKWKVTRNLPVPPIDVTSFSRVPASLNDLRVKDRIMASDGLNWLPGWVEMVKGRKVLVHFKGWNSRWDKWYNVNTGMLKTVNEYRREKKMHSATRNEGLYEIMKQKYPSFVATTLSETEINKLQKSRKRRGKKEGDSESDSTHSDHDNHNHTDNSMEKEHGGMLSDIKVSGDGAEIVDADIVMMHDKNEVFMEVLELPIHNEQDMVLNPPMFWCTSSLSEKAEHSICQLVRNCFGDLVQTLKDEDIWMMFKLCERQIDRVFFTLHCLECPERVTAYLKILRTKMEVIE